MKQPKIIVFEYLINEDSDRIQNSITTLKRINNLTYVNIKSQDQFFKILNSLKELKEPLIIQIIAHGNEFEISNSELGTNRIEYKELIDVILEIQKEINNFLVLNLMTVCNSGKALDKFHLEYPDFIHLTSVEEATFQGSIIHSSDIYKHEIGEWVTEIDQMNYNLSDEGKITYKISSF